MAKNLISIDDYNIDIYEQIFQNAQKYLQDPQSNLLKNKNLINLFFENSTRTRSSFEIAAKNLSANVINFDVLW